MADDVIIVEVEASPVDLLTEVVEVVCVEVGVQGPPGIPGIDVPQTFTSGEAIDVGDVLTLDTSGRVVRADATLATGLWQAIGVATTAAAAAGELVNVQTTGGRIASPTFVSAPAAAANGDPVFLSDTPGCATLVPPLVSGRVRWLLGTLQGADGATLTPAIVLCPTFVSIAP